MDAASRELLEETGLALPLTPLPDASPTDGVALFVTEVPVGRRVVLDHEHDRYAWLPLERALPMCLPSVVAAGLANAASWLEASRIKGET